MGTSWKNIIFQRWTSKIKKNRRSRYHAGQRKRRGKKWSGWGGDTRNCHGQWPMAMAHCHLKNVSVHVSRGNKKKYRRQIRSVKNLEIGPVGFPDVSDDQKLWNLAPNRLVWFSAHFGLICDQLGQWSSEIISSGAIWNHLAPAVPWELFSTARYGTWRNPSSPTSAI